MLADVPAGLQTLFAPQIQQLGMAERPVSFGGAAVLPETVGRGFLWVAPIGTGCLLSMHDFVLDREVELHEYPLASWCLGTMTKPVAAVAPVPDAARTMVADGEGALSFRQQAGEVRFPLMPGRRHRSTTLCFLPEFFDYASALTGIDAAAMKSALADSAAGPLPAGVARALSSLRPPASAEAADPLRYGAKVLEALSLVVSARAGATITCAAAPDLGPALDVARASAGAPPVLDGGAAAAESLVFRAERIMADRLADSLTVEALARELYVGKTTLANAFRAVRGCGAAERLAQLRMARARALLTAGVPAGECASRVGYRHQSSFCAAFKRACGLTPAEYAHHARHCLSPARVTAPERHFDAAF